MNPSWNVEWDEPAWIALLALPKDQRRQAIHAVYAFAAGRGLRPRRFEVDDGTQIYGIPTGQGWAFFDREDSTRTIIVRFVSSTF